MYPLTFDWHLLWLTLSRIGLAYLLALPTGWWSEVEGRAVGIRTFPIVAMASCGYIMIFSGIAGLPTGSDAIAANSRILQGLVAGIGFIGGGAILKDGLSVHGTAIAASVWNMGAIGAAVAVGRIEIAVVLSGLNLLTLRALVPVKKKLDLREKR